MNSAVYVGWVRHRRFADGAHAFRQRIFFCLLDLDELGRALRTHPWWRRGGWAPASYRREDYHGDARIPLAEAVRASVARALGFRPEGPVRLLTMLRSWGVGFNPVSFYFCHHRDGSPAAVLAEITNTPWLERHHYVLAAGPDGCRATFPKAFHVSPFQGMDLDYAWRLTAPGQRLGVHMVNRRGGRRTFDATLVLARREWSRGLLARLWFRFPAMPLLALAAIYLHALRLWRRGATFFPHPA